MGWWEESWRERRALQRRLRMQSRLDFGSAFHYPSDVIVLAFIFVTWALFDLRFWRKGLTGSKWESACGHGADKSTEKQKKREERGSLRTFGSQMHSSTVSCWARMKKSSLGLFLKTSTVRDIYIWNMIQSTKRKARLALTAFLTSLKSQITFCNKFIKRHIAEHLKWSMWEFQTHKKSCCISVNSEVRCQSWEWRHTRVELEEVGKQLAIPVLARHYVIFCV